MSSFDIINNFQYTDINSLKTFAIDFLNTQTDWLTGQAIYYELSKEYKKQNSTINFIKSLNFIKDYLNDINFEVGNNISDRSTVYIPEKYIKLLKKDKVYGLFYFWYITSSVLVDYYKVLSDSTNACKQHLAESDLNNLFKLATLHMTLRIYPLTENYYPIIFGQRVFISKLENINEELDNIMEDLLTLFNEVKTFSIQDLKEHIHDEKYATYFIHDEQFHLNPNNTDLYKNFFQINTTKCIGINRHHHLFCSEGTHQYIIYNGNIYFFGTKEFDDAKTIYYKKLVNKTYKV